MTSNLNLYSMFGMFNLSTLNYIFDPITGLMKQAEFSEIDWLVIKVFRYLSIFFICMQ